MIKNSKIKFYTLIALGVLLLTPISAFAQTADTTSLEKSVNELLTAKDSTDSALSPEEELKHRKNIVVSASKLALEEIDSFRKKINDLKPTEDYFKSQKDEFLKILDSLEIHYDSVIKNAEEITEVDKIKELAIIEKNYRETEYVIYSNKILQFILIFQTESLVKSAEIRYEKIGSDLGKLEKANLINANSYSKDMEEAQKSIAASRTWIEKAKTSLTPKEEEVSVQVMTLGKKATATPTTEELRTASIINLKSAYENFIKISTSVKKTLGR